MSGIVGFINLDREPADADILLNSTRALEFKSPDRTGTWRKGNVGLGHALLATDSAVCIGPRQPFTQGDSAWITADAHLYDTEELKRKLRSAGVNIPADVSEPELLLLAYRILGESFARHLVGDFAFGIWNADQNRLLCVRDQLGVRPLFYAHTAEVFIFGSDIGALLAHPAVSDELNEEYIADFLLFGSSIENDVTAYKHIKRLPAAHYLVVDGGRATVRSYWSPPVHQSIRYSQVSEYTEHFLSIFSQAVSQRIPAAQCALELSGGMDSGSVAAVAAEYARESGRELMAFTATCNGLIPEDREGHFAEITAAQLGIPLRLLASENSPLFDRFDSPALRTAEPFSNPNLALHYDKVKQIVDAGCRVLLTGQMGDALFAGSDTHFPRLLKTGRWVQFINDVNEHRRNHGSFTGLGLGAAARRTARKAMRKRPWQPSLPRWLNPSFAKRVNAEQRWNAVWQMWSELNDTPGQLRRPWLSTIFENYEALMLPMQVRHPLSDIRLVEFMVAAPNFIHLNKRVLREAMRGKLPAEIISRPKESLPGDLFMAKMTAGLCNEAPSFEATGAFIDTDRFASAYEDLLKNPSTDSTWNSWLVNNPIALAHWMNDNRLHL